MKVLFVPSDNNPASGAFLSMTALNKILNEKLGVETFVVLPHKGGQHCRCPVGAGVHHHAAGRLIQPAVKPLAVHKHTAAAPMLGVKGAKGDKTVIGFKGNDGVESEDCVHKNPPFVLT